jgi:hypothetical protein
VAGIEAGLWQLVPAVVESIIINPPLASPVPRPRQSRVFVGGEGLASKTGWGCRWNKTTLSCILFLMLIQGPGGTRYSLFVLCSLWARL